ncbi:hypothetical protein [Thiomicrorhabdus sp. 6S3-12]|uniref:hypothetical protein n=1 Tax=Thiomicrorhabdus sp. 6S3-12 TaxID=2819681 RepID=UPI001AAD5F54|nr:hypothetical protein [Thiomicrorhabdus sp. 6S3-12]MBO1924583.1 hypothetical protein [Thiomicrorhabdus sp. 6S3-12]
MTKAIEFFGALANIEHGPEKNTVLQVLSQEIDDFHLFKQVFEPGVIYASINWIGVLGRSAEVAAIASLLWQIYIDKVEPKLNQVERTKPALVISMKDNQGNIENIVVNGSYENKEVFINEFTEKIERLRYSSHEDETVLERIERSEKWIRVD